MLIDVFRSVYTNRIRCVACEAERHRPFDELFIINILVPVSSRKINYTLQDLVRNPTNEQQTEEDHPCEMTAG